MRQISNDKWQDNKYETMREWRKQIEGGVVEEEEGRNIDEYKIRLGEGTRLSRPAGE